MKYPAHNEIRISNEIELQWNTQLAMKYQASNEIEWQWNEMKYPVDNEIEWNEIASLQWNTMKWNDQLF